MGGDDCPMFLALGFGRANKYQLRNVADFQAALWPEIRKLVLKCKQ